MLRHRILIVEEGDQQRKFLYTILERLDDYQLDGVRSVAGAFQAASNLQSSLVLIDLASQETQASLGTGNRISQELGIPVIYLNGSRDDQALFSNGEPTNAYLPRPVSANALSAAIGLALQNYATQKKLQEQTRRCQAVLDLYPGKMCIFDRVSLRVLEANAAFADLFQRRTGRSAMAGLGDLLEPVGISLDEALAVADGQGSWEGRCKSRRDGAHAPEYRLHIRPATPGQPDSLWLACCGEGLRMSPENQRSVEIAERHRQEAETLREVTATLTETLELNEVLRRILSQLKKVIPYDGFSVMLWTDNRLTLLGNQELAERPHETLDIDTLPNVIQVIEGKQALIIPDTQKDERWLTFPGYEYIRCWLGVPLIVDDRVVGLFNLDKKQAGFYTEEDARLAMAFANQAAIALENARLHERTQRSLRRLSALRTIDNAISSSLDLRFTLEVLLNQVISNLEVDASDVLLFNEHAQTLSYAAGRGFHTGAQRHTHIRLGEDLAGQAALQRRIIAVKNLRESGMSFLRELITTAEGFCAYYAAPLIAKGQLKGVLEILNRTPIEPDQDWLDFLSALALQAAIAIDNVRLFEDLQHANLELTLAYDITLEGWAQALELRDRETIGHTRRVLDLTERLARRMGFTDEEIVHVRRGAILHDIGKMAIPDSILLKPEPLNDEEQELLNMHPVYAYEWLSPINFLKSALDIPYCHHEYWDGSGYPRGLQGEEIPLPARVFSVVDVWDKLTNGSTHQPGWPTNKVIEHIRSLSGVRFDPQVVEAFFTLVL